MRRLQAPQKRRQKNLRRAAGQGRDTGLRDKEEALPQILQHAAELRAQVEQARHDMADEVEAVLSSAPVTTAEELRQHDGKTFALRWLPFVEGCTLSDSVRQLPLQPTAGSSHADAPTGDGTAHQKLHAAAQAAARVVERAMQPDLADAVKAKTQQLEKVPPTMVLLVPDAASAAQMTVMLAAWQDSKWCNEASRLLMVINVRHLVTG